MDVREYIQKQVAGSRRILDAAIDDTRQEMVNVKTGEFCNTIGAAYAHVIGGEDYFVNVAIRGGQRLWESGGWAEKLGIPNPPGRDWAIQIPDLAAFQEYAKAVHAATDAYLESVTPEELDRIIKIFGNERPVANALILIANHGSAHSGEIASLKGIQGVKGLPF